MSCRVAEKYTLAQSQDAQWFSDKQKAKGGRAPKVSELDPEDDGFGALEPETSKPEPLSEPTMMSLDARKMFLSGEGQEGLHKWKVAELLLPQSILLIDGR